jgi:hypothetical protein
VVALPCHREESACGRRGDLKILEVYIIFKDF